MSIREQLEGVAQSISVWLVLFGGIGGAVIAIANLVSVSQAISDGRIGPNLIWPVIAAIIGLGLAGYFGYLALLKARLKRERR